MVYSYAGSKHVNTLSSGRFRGFLQKTTEMHVVLHETFSSPVSATDPVKTLKDATSLVACTRKKFFCWGMRIFCSNSWRVMVKHVPGTIVVPAGLKVFFPGYVTTQCHELVESFFLLLRTTKSVTAHFIVTAKLIEAICFANFSSLFNPNLFQIFIFEKPLIF